MDLIAGRRFAHAASLSSTTSLAGSAALSALGSVVKTSGAPLERFPVRPGQLTLLPIGQRIHGYTDGLGKRGEVRLFYEPAFVRHAIGADVNPSRLRLVRSMDLRNPIILQALAALGR